MVNVNKVLKVLKNTMPNASEQDIIKAVKNFNQAHPEMTDIQFLALMQQYMKTKKVGG